MLHGVSARDGDFGKTFLPLAKRFGFEHLVYAARNPAGHLLYEYLPEGDVLESWQHLGTVTLRDVGASWEEGAAAHPRFFDSFVRILPTVFESEAIPGPRGGAGFVSYEVGDGPLREHCLAVVWQVMPGTLAIFQAQQRSGPFSRRQATRFRAVARELAGHLAPPEPDGGELPPADWQANAALQLFVEACVEHLGQIDAAGEWVQERGMRPVDVDFAGKVLQGANGVVGTTETPHGHLLAVLETSGKCAVWARRATAAIATEGLVKLIEGTRRPGIHVEVLHDRQLEGAGGTYHQLVYFLSKEEQDLGWVFIATTTPSEEAEVQVRLTVSPAKNRVQSEPGAVESPEGPLQ